MDRQEAEYKLNQTFGFKKFFDDQWQTIERILHGKRVLLIEKTGFGKSLTFQFPATQFNCLTIIFSPLIALMRNQINVLNNIGVKAGSINSEQTFNENNTAIQQAIKNELKILYIAPERQENSLWQEIVQQINISFVVIDEAHCISSWGHDFRPAFKRIINLTKLLPANIPVLATTATATIEVAQDIKNQIGGDIEIIRGNLLRENLKLSVIQVNNEEDKMAWMANYLSRVQGNGIIYTGTRNNTEMFSKWCTFQQLNTVHYHAGLEADNRKIIEQAWMNNQYKAVISTNALGMGIDKPDIQFIIHTQIPQSPIHYYQEIGRAGRDGELAEIFLLFNPKDIDLPTGFINNSRPTIANYHKIIEFLQQEPYTERELIRATNLKNNQVRVIKADLLDQKIIREVMYGRSKKYEYQYNAPKLDTTTFENLRQHKFKELAKIIEYANTDKCKMLFLCNYLGDFSKNNCKICDNCLAQVNEFVSSNSDKEKIQNFQNNLFPIVEVATKKTKNNKKYMLKLLSAKKFEGFIDNVKITKDIYRNLNAIDKDIIDKLMEEIKQKSRLVDGVAASYYGMSNFGKIIYKCKYENGGDFPDILLKQTIQAFEKHLKYHNLDLILFVPPTKSGQLVENFAKKIAMVLNLPLAPLTKIRTTEEQKQFENITLKTENVKNAFAIKFDISKRNILLIDDVCDSGATIKEIGTMLTNKGATIIVPLVIAKTVGGDLAK